MSTSSQTPTRPKSPVIQLRPCAGGFIVVSQVDVNAFVVEAFWLNLDENLSEPVLDLLVDESAVEATVAEFEADMARTYGEAS